MALTSFHTKYRPSTYNEVIGQEHITSILKGLVRNKTFKSVNSYIFGGTAGGGKTTLSRIFAKAINCKEPIDGNPCEKCEHCSMFSKGNYPDFIEYDGASHNKLESVKPMLYISSLHTNIKDGYRVLLIDEAHRLTKEAWDLLLKTLEESEDRTVWIFATTEPNKIRPAIISRAYNFVVKPLNVQEISSEIIRICKKEQIDYTLSSVKSISVNFKGKMRDALKTIDMYAKANNSISDIHLKNKEQVTADSIKLVLLGRLEESISLFDTIVDVSLDVRAVVSNTLYALSVGDKIDTGYLDSSVVLSFRNLVQEKELRLITSEFLKYKPDTVDTFYLFLTVISEIGQSLKATKAEERDKPKRAFRNKYAINQEDKNLTVIETEDKNLSETEKINKLMIDYGFRKD
ncbi:DNA polymerase III, gamma/tau subunit [Thiovulum sp. ES]|nr:DNA polymerase III, gamma/tau subunit [Thiovulum sp. ES]